MTELPIVKLVKPEQFRKALPSIEVTELGIVKEPVKPEQFLNAKAPIEVTELPIVKLEKPVQLPNA